MRCTAKQRTVAKKESSGEDGWIRTKELNSEEKLKKAPEHLSASSFIFIKFIEVQNLSPNKLLDS